MRARSAVRAFALAALGAVGCQAIAGIENRHYEPLEAGTTKTTASALCKTYCKEVMDACTGANAQYTDMDTCLGVCAELKPGEIHEPSGNTAACREQQARNAQMGEPETYCKSAGPSGDPMCGTACESYCDLFASICSKVETALPNCPDLCKELLPDVDVNPAAADTGDTLECRFYHVSAAAAASDPTVHCGHARLANPTSNCVDTTPASCDHYCQVVTATCDGSSTDAGRDSVYESTEQCHDVCNALPALGSNTDDGVDSVGCRTYHAFNAVLYQMPDVHCPHAGPGGDGACGDNCTSYCELVAKACPTESKDHFGTDADACKTECGKLDGVKAGSGYNIDTPDGNTVQCRLLRTARAFHDNTQCAAALGAAPCK
ncbi:MAG TPA: hypothetical protein VHC69_05730 [Polyangiaceae bacterium]|nr:hypothetical protein [Polyangiaceae bacterium]